MQIHISPVVTLSDLHCLYLQTIESYLSQLHWHDLSSTEEGRDHYGRTEDGLTSIWKPEKLTPKWFMLHWKPVSCWDWWTEPFRHGFNPHSFEGHGSLSAHQEWLLHIEVDRRFQGAHNLSPWDCFQAVSSRAKLRFNTALLLASVSNYTCGYSEGPLDFHLFPESLTWNLLQS